MNKNVISTLVYILALLLAFSISGCKGNGYKFEHTRSAAEVISSTNLRNNRKKEIYFQNVPTKSPQEYIDLEGHPTGGWPQGCNDNNGKRLYADDILVEWSIGLTASPYWKPNDHTVGHLSMVRMPSGTFEKTKSYFSSNIDRVRKAISNQENEQVFDSASYNVLLQNGLEVTKIYSVEAKSGHEHFFEFYLQLDEMAGDIFETACAT